MRARPPQVSFEGTTRWYGRDKLVRFGDARAAKPSVTSSATVAMAASGGHPALYVGDTVKRASDWKWGDQDGGEGTVGTVRGLSSGNWVTVKWPNGNSNTYRYGRNGSESAYDVEIVVPDFTHPAHPHVLTWQTCHSWTCDVW